jgi:hypothetical protein
MMTAPAGVARNARRVGEAPSAFRDEPTADRAIVPLTGDNLRRLPASIRI